MKYRPKSIREVGLKSHLNDTIPNHNNLTYSDFVNLMAWTHVKPATIAKEFGVDRRTVLEWIAIYKEELDNATKL